MRAISLSASLLLIWSSLASAEDVKSTPPPAGAKVLFNGKDLESWVMQKGNAPPVWRIEDGQMECKPGSGSILTTEKFGPDFQLHVEFWLPLMKDAKGQGRSNSGVYLQGRYEIQVLDSYMNDTYPGGSVGALYQILTPDLEAQKKAVKPPEQWNAYDITFRAPRVDAAGKVTTPGQVTVVLNGETLIAKGAFEKTTGGAIDQKLGEPGPLLLQDHGNKIRFRNIWIKPLSDGK